MASVPKRILLVEDDSELQRTYNDLLTSEGFVVELVNTGTAAITAIMNATPDLVLLDIMLPGGMNGLDVLKWVRSSSTTPQLPIVVFTNLSGEEAAARELGATSYVLKAETPADELIKLIKHLT